MQDWLDNWQPRGTPCGPLSSRACKAHLNSARFAGVRVPRVDERRVARPRPTPPGPASSPASWITRGKEHPTARLSGPGAGQVWHRVQELGSRARKRLVRLVRIATLDPFQGQQERHRLACSKDATSVLDAFHIVTLAGGDAQVRCAVASSRTRPVTVGAQAIPSTTSGFSCAPRVIGSRSVNKNDSVRPSRQMRHTMSVAVAYHCAQHVRDVFHQATPTHSRRLTKTPHQAPTNVSHP